MQTGPRAMPVTSKFIFLYTKLLQGVPPTRLDANGDPQQLFSDILDLKVDATFLANELQQLSKDQCVGRLNPFLSSLFEACLRCASTAAYGEARKDYALETLTIVSRCCLSKNLSGWEVMEMVSGSVGQSDRIFNEFTLTLNTVIGDNDAPATTRCHAVRLGLAFVCAISQLSAGAYFLRRNLFPSIINFIKCPEVKESWLDAALFLAILANYHKSDAARMNPFLKRIKDCDDGLAMRNIRLATIPALNAAVRWSGPLYPPRTEDIDLDNQRIHLGILEWRKICNAFKRNNSLRCYVLTDFCGAIRRQRPIVQAVALLPVYEFIAGNASFLQVLLEDLEISGISQAPWVGSFLNLTSYLFTNASSSSSSRTMSYANLQLEVLLLLVENQYGMGLLSTRSAPNVQLCRQRLPRLPQARQGRPVLCDTLDCCNLWLRHNLNRQLSVHSYAKSIWICHRVIWYLQQERIRLDYEWKELWISVLGVFSFLANKFDTLITTGGIGQLILDGLSFLELAVASAEVYLPTAQATYDLVYELVRSATALRKHLVLLDSVVTSPCKSDGDALRYVLDIAEFYEAKISGSKDAQSALRVIAQEIELNGLHRPTMSREREPQAEDILDFARHGCGDGLGLVN